MVEDDPLVSEVIVAALEDDYDTILVGTATDALARLREGEIRLMLLDCTLPGGLDGNLIPEADRVGVRVILMSGDQSRIDKLVGDKRLDRPRPFVLKPFSLTGLLATVEQVIARTS